MTFPKLERVLCPVDFSAPSRRSAEVADQLATSWGASLTLLHVRPAVERALMDSVHPESPEAIAHRLGDIFERLQAMTARMKCAEVETDVVHGDPLTEILRRAPDYDLLVIATRGRHELTDFLMGSTAERLVRGAQCSVLVVR